MSGEFTQAVRLSLRLDAVVFNALQENAKANHREVGDHIQEILTKFAIKEDLLTQEIRDDYTLMWSLVAEVVRVAIDICRKGHFGSDITYKAIQQCMTDPKWASDYERYVRDNPYKNGNPRKGGINKEIGFRIRAAIGGETIRNADGTPAKVTVRDSIIQSYTPMKSFTRSAVA